jgi:signal transduction histidine kinase
MRYSEANTVLTDFYSLDDYIFFTVEDNGKGFDTTSLQNRKSFGILGMKERVLSVNGTFDLISIPGKGTKVILKLPHNTIAGS